MNNQEIMNSVRIDDKGFENQLTYNNHNSKTDIQAKNFNKSKVFDMKTRNMNVDLSRVDSQNYPDATETLDYIAIKMGLSQNNNNKPDCNTPSKPFIEEKCPETVLNHTVPVKVIHEKPTNETESQKPQEQHKKTNLMTKILRRLSRPSIFSKEKKARKSKEKQSSISNRPSLSSDAKSNTISDNVNHTPLRSKSFRQKMMSRFTSKDKQVKEVIISDTVSNVDSRPSETIGDCVGSCNDVYTDKLYKEELEKYNSSSVDCILDHRIGRLINQQESESSNSEDLRDHERKMNASNHQLVSIFCTDVSENNKSDAGQVATRVEEDKLSPLNVTINSLSIDGDRTCHSAMSAQHNDTSSNVKLTLSLYGYSAYGLSSSRFTSKSCMEFRCANISSKSKISMDNIAMINENVISHDYVDDLNDTLVDVETVDVQEDVVDAKTEVVEAGDIGHMIETSLMKNNNDEEAKNVVLRKADRPTEIQLRKSRMSSQTSMARSSLIMVAVAHNSPRTKGGNTPVYNPDSPCFPGKKLDFDEDNKAIEEEKIDKVEHERNGNDFLAITNQYESDMIEKIDVVQKYLDSWQEKMDEDVIGELNTAVGLAKLLLSEKFVQFRTLCEKNLREPADGEFKTLACDLEGYLTTLEIQIANLNGKFQWVEKIRDNDWRMPTPVVVQCPATPRIGGVGPKKKSRTKASPADNHRAQEARRRIAEFKKMSVAAATAQSSSSSLLLIQ